MTPLTVFDEEHHAYLIDGVVVPSVTQVLTDERFIDFSNVPNGIREDAMYRGRYVHAVLHYALENDYDLDDCDPRYRGYVDSAFAYLADVGKKPLRDPNGQSVAVEFRFWHVARMFAGTIDYVGVDADGALSIDDWKTGSPVDVAASIQTAAYECGLRQSALFRATGYDGPIKRRAVKLHRDGRPGTPEPYNDPRDLAVFFAALTCVHFRRNTCRHPAAARLTP